MNRNLVLIIVVVAVFILTRLLTRHDSRTLVSQALKAGAKIIDVRTPREFAQGHYEGAVNIPLGDLHERMAEVGPKEGAVVVYCAAGPRAAVAKRTLKKAGYEKVLNTGGLRHMP